MDNHRNPLRLGTTAIAAVIALSATPLLAQTAEPQAEAPVIAAPATPAIAADEAAPAAPIAAPQAAIADPAPALNAAASEPAAPAPVVVNGAVQSNGTTIGTPVVHTADAAEEAAAPVVRRTARATATRTVATMTAPAAPIAAPAPAARAETPAPVATPPATAADQTARSTRTTTTDTSDDTALWIGGGALGLVVLGGGAYALARRRRDDEDEEHYLAEDTVAAPAPVIREEAPLAVAPVVAPAAATAGANTLPSGFDLSRFGPHVQAAYRGPTEDNPSLSLKTRLRRAAALDQRERMNEAAPAEARTTATALEAPVLRGDTDRDEQIVIRPGTGRRRGGFTPSLN